MPDVIPPDPAKKPKKKRYALDPDWRLTLKLGQETLDTYAVDRDTVLREAMRFKMWWLEKGEGKADWDATWRKWVSSKYLNWPLRPIGAGLLAEVAFSKETVAATPMIMDDDPWEAERIADAIRRAEEA
ncbi:MAG: hypothetical protein H0U59_09675 [Gemmatimonadaceae bacterium]|nr:hypothetical protein [Gemmatimonadaceae bacterium]